MIASPLATRALNVAEARVVEQLGPAHRLRQSREEAVAGGDDADVLAVGGLPVVERRRILQPVALAPAHDAEAVVGGQGVLEDAEDGLVQREVHGLAAAAMHVAVVERDHDRQRVEHAGEVVGDDDAGTHRRPIGVAGEVEEAAEADAVAVEAGAIAVRSGLPVDRRAGDDQVGMLARQHVRPDPPFLERAGLEVLDHDVGLARQCAEQLLAARLAQIERDRLLVAPLHRPPQRRAALVERPDAAHEVAGPRQLDLDDLGAEIAEQGRRERRRDPRADVEDANTLEWQRHRRPKTTNEHK